MSFLSFLGLGSGTSAGGLMRTQQQRQEEAIKQATDSINKSFAGYDDKFYKQREQAFDRSAMPQLQKEVAGQQHQLGYNLARRGLGKGSTAQQLGESLAEGASQQQQDLLNMGKNQANALKSNITGTQQDLIRSASLANAPASNAQNAIAAASNYSAPSILAPIGQLFGNWANMYLAKQNQNTYSQIGGVIQPFQSASTGGGYGGSFMNPVSTVKE
jgi:hypothetical protein